MSVAILSSDDLGAKSILIQYLIHYSNEDKRSIVLLFNERIDTFLAEYLCVKNMYFDLHIDKLTYNKKRLAYTIPKKAIILNNLDEGEVVQYEQEVAELLDKTRFFSTKNKSFDQYNSLISTMEEECIFVFNYIKFLADCGHIVEQGMDKIKLLESTLEQDGRKLFFTSFIPSLDYKTRQALKQKAVKMYDNVILCVDKRLLIYTKEDIESKNCMEVSSKNEHLVAYRIKHESKVDIE